MKNIKNRWALRGHTHRTQNRGNRGGRDIEEKESVNYSSLFCANREPKSILPQKKKRSFYSWGVQQKRRRFSYNNPTDPEGGGGKTEEEKTKY